MTLWTYAVAGTAGLATFAAAASLTSPPPLAAARRDAGERTPTHHPAHESRATGEDRDDGPGDAE